MIIMTIDAENDDDEEEEDVLAKSVIGPGNVKIGECQNNNFVLKM